MVSKIETYLLRESPKADKFSIWFTSFPTIIIFSIILISQTRNFYWTLLPIIFIGILLLSKPVTNCEFCKEPLEKKVDGFIEYHIQCECVKNRWRPIWYSWIDNLHNKIFSKRNKL